MDPQFFERGDLILRGKQMSRSKSLKEGNELSGAFILHAISGFQQGSMSAFVRLPDGSTQTLGNVSLGGRTESSIPFGPFTQKGTYSFGMNVEGGTSLTSQVKIGTLEVNVNDSNVKTHDFFVPARSPAHYELHPCEYILNQVK